MDIEEVRSYCLSLPCATEAMPYGPDWLVFRVEGKIFLHICMQRLPLAIAVKLPPEEGTALRECYTAITPAYHLNKRHWSDIVIENTFSTSQIEGWIRESYETILQKLPRAKREKIECLKKSP